MRMIAAVSVVAVMLLAAGVASAYIIEHSHSQGLATSPPTNFVSFTGGAPSVDPYLGRFIMDPVGTLPGVYTYTIPGLGSPPHSHDGFFSYCLEPDQGIGVGHGVTYDFSIVSLVTDKVDALDALLIRELFGRYSPLLQNDPTGPYTGGTFRTAAAALQLAIWKINLDRATETLGSWDFNSGLMRVSSANVPFESTASKKPDVVALEMLNSLTGTGSLASQLQGLHNDTYQDLLIQMPEPATMAFLALGGIGLLARRRRMRK